VRRWVWFAALGAAVLASGQEVPHQKWTYWIQPCSAEIASESGCHAGDPELGVWALEAWKKAAGGALALSPAKNETTARLRLYWANGREKLYGEMRPVVVNGERGAEVFVLPSVAGPEGDPLMRDAIVYLTCLHESGHALGLPHTRSFEDIMYSFQYGGDVPAYFGRYRRTIANREDIRSSLGLSAADRTAIATVLR
jgi:hypothetical protein